MIWTVPLGLQTAEAGLDMEKLETAPLQPSGLFTPHGDEEAEYRKSYVKYSTSIIQGGFTLSKEGPVTVPPTTDTLGTGDGTTQIFPSTVKRRTQTLRLRTL